MDEILKDLKRAPDVLYEGIKWKLWHDDALREGQKQVDIDHLLLEQHHKGYISPVIRLWQNGPSLVLSRRDTQRSEFGATKAYFNQRNIPLYVRTSGGTAVPHGPGVLNISLIFSAQDDKMTLDQSYAILCDLVKGAVKQLGITACISQVAGAFCDGRYNLTIGGRKVGGSAQRIKKHPDGRKSFLSHMCLLVDVDVEKMVATISDFYHQCGTPYPINPKTVTTVAKEMHGRDGRKKILQCLRKSLDEVLLT